MIEVELPDGTIVEFPEGTPPEVMQRVLAGMDPAAPPAQAVRNEDGTYGQPPEGMFLNPITGQMTDRNMLAAHVNPTRGEAIRGGAMQGLGFGFGDELAGLVGRIQGGPDMGTFRREQARATLGAQQEAFPFSYGAGEVGGGVASSLAGAGALGLGIPATMAGQMGQGAALGAAEGALYGFGGGEGIGDRAGDAATTGGFGALVGGAAPAVIQGARSLFDRAVAAPVASMRSAPSQTRASQAVAAALERSGRTVDDVADSLTAAHRAGQPEFMTVDALGNPGQRMLSGIARQPGNASTQITDFLMNRQGGQARRIAGALDDSLNYGNTGKTANQVRAGIEAARDAAADAQYGAARQGAGAVDVRPVIAAIDDTIGPMQGSGVAGDGVDDILRGFRNRIAAPEGKLPEGATAVELSDFNRLARLRKEMGDKAQSLAQSGQKFAAGEIRKLMNVLDEQLEAASEGYRAANANFRSASKVADAVDTGAAMARPRARVPDTLQTYAGMTPEQQAAARAGYVDPLIGRIENSAPGVNKARQLLDPGTQAEIGAMARDPKSVADFLAREQTMFETGARALGGSRTADNLADIADVKTLDVGPIINALSGRFGAAAQQIAGKAGNAMLGRNTATREEIARLLLSPDIRAALQPAMRRQLQEGQQNRVVEALVRSLERSAMGATE